MMDRIGGHSDSILSNPMSTAVTRSAAGDENSAGVKRCRCHKPAAPPVPFPYGLVPLSLHAVVLARQSIEIGTMGMECAGRMRGGDVWSEGWKKTGMRHGFEAGGEPNQRSFTEGRADETDSHRHAENITRWHVDDRISRRPRQTRAGEQEVIRKDQIGRFQAGLSVGATMAFRLYVSNAESRLTRPYDR